MCGPLDYKPFFGAQKEQLVNDGSEPLTFVSSTRTFTINTDDEFYHDRIEIYGVRVCFKNYPPGDQYPNVSTNENESTIDFDDACLNPFDLQGRPQTSPEPNYFDGLPIVFDLN